MANFDNVNVSPNLERIRKQYQRTLCESMQEYLDERNNGELSISDSQVTALFNDFLLYLNDGSAPEVEVHDPNVT